MNDSDLKNHLLETCQVLPGQEGRAWLALKERLAQGSQRRWLFFPAWQSLAYTTLALLLLPAIFDLGLSMRPIHHALAFADSQVPGIYATSFYSHSAQAQVVWLNGLDPATDKPTYLDPTSVIRASSAKAPDSL
jgi:hypothetical protein